MALFGLKLWENAFQTIPDISFFDVEKKNWRKFLTPGTTRKLAGGGGGTARKLAGGGNGPPGSWQGAGRRPPGSWQVGAGTETRPRQFEMFGPWWREDFRREEK